MPNRRYRLAVLAAVLCLLVQAPAAYGQVSAEDFTRNMSWRNVGPANMSGRITNITALDDDYRHVVVASASGGVWKSTNAGTTWQPIFDNYGAASIGDVAIFQPNPDIIWVGTGEPNNRNSVAWGDGVYKSTDGGQTFTNMGLKDTHQIAKVLTHPSDPDIAYVGAIGHLWGYSGDRGIFKTTDGGQTWDRVFYVDEKTGCSDLAMDPSNPDVLYAGMYQRLRRPYRFDSGGPNGGVFKSTDGGRTWTQLTRGLPRGDTGKIGLSVFRGDPRIVMVFIEAEPVPRDEQGDLSNPRSGVYRSTDSGANWEYVNTYQNRPFYYTHIRVNPSDDQRVYLLTGSFQQSMDGGQSLQRAARGIHGDYHAMWIDPNDPDRYYVGSDGGVALTQDHGQTFLFFDTIPVSQFYAVAVDMREPYYVYGGLQDNGTWAGPSNSRDSRGILTDHWASIGGGDGFHVQVDPTDYRTVYLESQGGSLNRIDMLTRQRFRVRPGTQNVINADDFITPELMQMHAEAGLGNQPFRFNWSAPIIMSPHNPNTVYFGGNVLFKTVDRGESWMIISPDLTTNDPVKISRDTGGLTRDATGAENHCNIISISESPITPGVIWAGTDDGNVQITRDGGVTWSNMRSRVPGVPEGIWVSRVEASHFEEGTCYLTFDGHRSDNFKPYVFRTTDYGESWTDISANIPDGHSVYVIKEDLRNPNLLFVGTEFALFASLDGGDSWFRLMNGLPTVAIHDLVIHPRDNDLVAATHGRGIWILDDITALQQLSEEVVASDAFLFEARDVTQWLNISRGGSRGHHVYAGENPQGGAAINFYLKESPDGPVEIEISDVAGELTRSLRADGQTGINQVRWNMRFDPSERQKVEYIASLTQRIEMMAEQMGASRRQRRDAERIVADLNPGQSPQELQAANRAVMQALGAAGGQGGGGFGGGGGRGGLGGLQGAQAGPGTYRVTLYAAGQTLTGTITLKADPLLEGGN
jgi:photosystem II stability/assembly factor-like uncharacterized protein